MWEVILPHPIFYKLVCLQHCLANISDVLLEYIIINFSGNDPEVFKKTNFIYTTAVIVVCHSWYKVTGKRLGLLGKELVSLIAI